MSAAQQGILQQTKAVSGLPSFEAYVWRGKAAAFTCCLGRTCYVLRHTNIYRTSTSPIIEGRLPATWLITCHCTVKFAFEDKGGSSIPRSCGGRHRTAAASMPVEVASPADRDETRSSAPESGSPTTPSNPRPVPASMPVPSWYAAYDAVPFQHHVFTCAKLNAYDGESLTFMLCAGCRQDTNAHGSILTCSQACNAQYSPTATHQQLEL